MAVTLRTGRARRASPPPHASRFLLVAVFAVAAGACTAPAPPRATAAAPAVAAMAAPTGAPQLKPLRVEPVSGFVGDTFRVAGDGLPPGASVEWQWVTWDGGYETQAVGHDVRFMQRRYQEKRVALGRATADAAGRAEAALTAPRDFGEIHDLYAVVDGRDVARGGYRIVRRASITPSEGPVGTPITIEVTGMAWRPFDSTMALRYDNAYTGFVSGVTTAGAATFHVRAAGPPGRHMVLLTAASPGVPFLNNQQSGTANIPNMELKFLFTVTGDTGAPAASAEWPSAERVAALSRAAAPRPRMLAGVSASVEPATATVGSNVVLRARGLPPGARVQLLWTMAGVPDPNQPPWLRDPGAPAAESTTAPDGSLVVPFAVTDDRGGWHIVKLMQGGQAQAELPLYVRRTLAGIAPQRVRVGEAFTVEVKGGGWTELDKGVAVTYDNSYIGFACSATSGGDITMHLVATGAPGTHLVDLYPTLYRQPGAHPAEYWNFELPHLTALDDHPGLGLGYELPIFRLAIEVIDRPVPDRGER